jgi:hypothetical protein
MRERATTHRGRTCRMSLWIQPFGRTTMRSIALMGGMPGSGETSPSTLIERPVHGEAARA